MAKLPFSAKQYDGHCEVCGDTAELRDSRTTMVLQSTDDHRISTIGTKLVRCYSGEHAYFVADWETQVQDPFEEGEDLDMTPLDMELPPPPPKEDH